MSKLFVDEIVNQSSQGSGTITIGASGETVSFASGVTGLNYPAFEAYLSADQTNLADNVATKLQANTVVFDTDSCYDNTTNYRFTPQTAGKYFVYASVRADEDGGDLSKIQNQISKNGSTVTGIGETAADFRTGGGTDTAIYSSGIVDMNGSSDYLEVFVQVDSVSGNSSELKASGTYFGAYKIIE